MTKWGPPEAGCGEGSGFAETPRRESSIGGRVRGGLMWMKCVGRREREDRLEKRNDDDDDDFDDDDDDYDDEDG